MIPNINLPLEYRSLDEEMDKAIHGVIEKGWFVLGEEAAKFEEEFSRYIGSKYGIGVNSGSDALFLGLKALGIGPGDEVVTVSHTFISTVDAIVRNGARPIFVDIDPKTYCIDAIKIEELITRKTRAILPVHLYGHPADMSKILELAEKYDLFVIEDACQAHGARYRSKCVGGFGDVGCFSFYPTKNLGAYGDGGMAVTNDEDLAEKIKMLRNYGQSKKYHYEIIGINSRLDEIQASILRTKLKYLDDWNERRRSNCNIYNNFLGGSAAIVPFEKEDSRHVYHQYVIRVKSRDALKQNLSDKGIQTQIHYPIPVHKQNAYLEFSTNIKLPITERICTEILSLPMNPWITPEELAYISNTIKDLLN